MAKVNVVREVQPPKGMQSALIWLFDNGKIVIERM
jgi:hypothetical protein